MYRGSIWRTLLVIFLSFASVQASAAVIMDFENVNATSTHIDQNGFNLDLGGQYGFFQIFEPSGASGVPQNGTSFVQMSTQNAYPATLTAASGSTFDFSSIDVGEYSSVYREPRKSTFFGYTETGDTLVEEVWVDGVFDGLGGVEDFETFSFGGAWTNLVKVEFISALTFDNIVLNAGSAVSVPEPGTLGLLTMGLIGFCCSKKWSR